eukprot:Opistho-2@63850
MPPRAWLAKSAGMDTRSRPVGRCWRYRARLSAPSTSAARARACSSTPVPNSVRVRRRVLRCSSFSPRRCSSAATRRETVDLGRCTRSAARLKEPASTTRANSSRSSASRLMVIVPLMEQSYPICGLLRRDCCQYIGVIVKTTKQPTGVPAMNILQINSSARRVQDGQGSFSTRLAAEVVEALKAGNAGAKLTVRDLGLQSHPAMDEAALGALFTPAEARSAEQNARVAENDVLISELQAQDVVVIGAPMINFGIPTQLKNWIDAVARAGTTFRYTASGPEGLIKGKKVYVVLTRGGVYRDQ